MSPQASMTQPAKKQSIAQKSSLWDSVFRDEPRDNWQTLAWVNSVCLLFLVIGILGLNTQSNYDRKLIRKTIVVPVVALPEPPPEQDEPKSVNPSPTTVQHPRSVVSPALPVVAAAEPAEVAFPIPIEGPATLVASRYAAPTRVQTSPAEPSPLPFKEDANPRGYFPKPKYPLRELAARHEGRVTLAIEVGRNGKVLNVTIKESCGWPKLDAAALEKVHKDWDFGPGPLRSFYVPVVFQIQ
jgi:protein TonB